jgi:GT2 family glycosyltransferase
MEPQIAISIVTYRTAPATLNDCLGSVIGIRLPFLCTVLDNASDPAIRQGCQAWAGRLPSWGRLEYRANPNVGYGRAHNLAMRDTLDRPDCRYHIAANPDIAFGPGTVERLAAFMDEHPDAGAVMPKVLYPDGTLQHLCKLLPAPGHLMARRFWPKRAARYEAVYTLRNADYSRPFECPCLSGCFMMLRTEELRRAGLFDERFFLYFEDVDLVRRIGRHCKTLYCPVSEITHGYQKGSYSSLKLLAYHARSAVQYFNKWGWLGDTYRTEKNRQTLDALSL